MLQLKPTTSLDGTPTSLIMAYIFFAEGEGGWVGEVVTTLTLRKTVRDLQGCLENLANEWSTEATHQNPPDHPGLRQPLKNPTQKKSKKGSENYTHQSHAVQDDGRVPADRVVGLAAQLDEVLEVARLRLVAPVDHVHHLLRQHERHTVPADRQATSAFLGEKPKK